MVAASAGKPLITCPSPLAAPDSSAMSVWPSPMTATRPSARSVDQGNAGRRSRGTPQTELNAFCTAMATPRAPSSAPIRPITSARPVLFRACTLS